MQDKMLNATEEANKADTEPQCRWGRSIAVSIASLGIAAMIILGTSGGTNEVGAEHNLGLTVAQKSPSTFAGSFGAGPHTIHAQTTGKSVSVQHQLAHESQPAMMFSAESKVLHGHEVTETKIKEQTFVTILSRDQNKVMLEGTAPSIHPAELKQMYEEDAALHPRIKKANAAYHHAKEGTPIAFMSVAHRVATFTC
jgi:hypothetical protein